MQHLGFPKQMPKLAIFQCIIYRVDIAEQIMSIVSEPKSTLNPVWQSLLMNLCCSGLTLDLNPQGFGEVWLQYRMWTNDFPGILTLKLSLRKQ